MGPSHLEIGTSDEGGTREFLKELFGWSFTPMDHGGVFDTGAIKTGLHGNDPAPGITVYFEVADIDAAAAKVRALGGTADDPSPEEPGFGRFSACTDPHGVKFGLHQKA